MIKKYTTWKIASPAPKEFKNKIKDYSNVIIDLLYSRLGNNPKDIKDFFQPDYEKGIYDPFILKDMEKAVDRILEARKRKEKVIIFGDYDVDGITSSAVMTDVLTRLKIENSIYIPDRGKEGYGMNEKAVKYLARKKTNLIVTVDCGVRDIKEIELAKELGMEVVVTDHHLPGKKIPKAVAVVNPHRKDDGYPWKDLAGVGVAFKLACALIQKSPKGVFKEGYEKWLLDLVALGTVADMVPLKKENRVLVKYGLIVLGKTKRLGIKALFKKSRLPLSAKEIPNTGQISFQIAPRLNSAGRMDHANTAFCLITSQDEQETELIADSLELKNGRRQRVTEKIVKEIEKKIDLKQKVVFLGGEDWPIGILGLVAGRVCDRFCRPTFIFNKDKDGCRGSIRSIPKFKVVKVLEECKKFFSEYGGHDMAGGFVFPLKNLKSLKKKVEQIAQDLLQEKDLSSETLIDRRLDFSEIDWKLIEDLSLMEPFGMGNSAPLFLAEKVVLDRCQIVGNGSKHLKMRLRQDNFFFEAIAFGKGEQFCHLVDCQNPLLDIVFELSNDEWNGNKRIQLLIREMRQSPK